MGINKEREETMKKLLICILMVFLVACADQTIIYKFSTGAALGAYYPIGAAISEILSDNTDDYIVNAYSSSASVSNMTFLAEGSVDLAIIQSNIAYWGYQGVDMFETPLDNIRGVASLYPEYVQIIVNASSGIENIYDLKGKKINIGSEGSGIYFDAVAILDKHGIGLNDFIPYNYDFNESTEELLEGEIDGIIMTSGIPNNSILKLQSEMDLNFISLDQNTMVDLVASNPYYSIERIEAAMYSDLEEPLDTLSVRALWVCSDSLDEETVYEMTKTLWKNVDKLDVHDSAAMIRIIDAMKGMSIELHPGAKKYYKEQGMVTD